LKLTFPPIGARIVKSSIAVGLFMAVYFIDVNMFKAVNNQLINDGCGLFRGRQILPFEHLSRFQNDLID
jgi:hypothetical protein